MQERSNLENSLSIFSKLKNEFDEISELLDLYAKEDQTSEEFEEDILLSLTNLSEKADLALMESMLSGEADSNSAYLEFHPGAGGTESQDWAQMLSRMYSRWGESRGYKIEIAYLRDLSDLVIWLHRFCLWLALAADSQPH